MMKKFIMTVLGSFVGSWIALTLVTITSMIMSFAMFAMMATMKAPQASLEDKSVLSLDLEGLVVSDRPATNELARLFSEESTTNVSLDDVIDALKSAKENKKIKGLSINCGGISAGIASLYDIRKAIVDFKKSGKPVYAYGYEGITQGDYYLASVADSIFLNPSGMVDVHGLAAQMLFFKKALDNLGVEMQVLRVGTFKSAVEPYILTEASEANRMQTEHYMGCIWSVIRKQMAESRKIDDAKFNALADSMLMTYPAEELKKLHLIDGICYKHEYEAKLKKLEGVNYDEDLRSIAVADMPKLESNGGSSDKLAVLYAEGEIDGGSDGGIDTRDMVDIIADLTKDDDVKGLVLRVNSPGGSAFGSEQMWEALDNFKKQGKVFVVSMGDVAASGGYYISCGAQKIFAEPVTITGSIGIFGMIPCAKGLITDKIGVTQTLISTNNNSVMSLLEPMNAFQQQQMQGYINRGYELFTSRCATGRKMPIDSLKSIAEGRVWDGVTAKKIGLVDELGGLAEAVNYAKTLVAKNTGSEKESITIEEYPDKEDAFLKMLKKSLNASYEAKARAEFGVLYDSRKELNKVLSRDKVLCLEPVKVKL